MSEEADQLAFLEAVDETITSIEERERQRDETLLRLEGKIDHLANMITLLHDQVVEGFRKDDLRLKRVESNGNGRYHVSAE